jgi:thiol-disulfide isomerase/thioredoxin
LNLKKKILLLIPGICSMINVFSQNLNTQPKQEGLKIGDTVPEIIFNDMVNYSAKTAKLSDFKGKLVILDFWATWCSPCVGALPKLDSLQREFKNQMMILPVSEEPTEKVINLFKENNDLKNTVLPSATNTFLNTRKYFPHRSIPHEIWLDGTGKIVAITGGEDVNAETIKKYLKNGVVKTEEKRDVLAYNDKKPMLMGFFENMSINPEEVKYASTFLPYITGVITSLYYPYRMATVTKAIATNSLMQNMYKLAFAPAPLKNYRDAYLNGEARLVWEVKDLSLVPGFIKSENRKGLKENLFNYEIIRPVSEYEHMPKIIEQDLNNFFGSNYGIIAKKEKRKVLCWVVTNVKKTDTAKREGIKKQLMDFNMYAKNMKAVNLELDYFLTRWITYYIPMFKYPIINGSGYTGIINFEINADPNDFHAVKKALEKKGFVFKLKKQTIDMIVFKDAR